MSQPTIGNYRIVQTLAGGGMGMVHIGEHQTLGTRRVVKVLLPNLAMDPKVRGRFLQEAQLQHKLDHPNIVRVHDFIEDGPTLAIVMDFVDGPSLEAVLDHERPGAWPVADALAVMGPVVRAIATAHAAGIVHRDLKPANVLMDRTSRDDALGVPKVTDFGIAKILSTQKGVTREGSQLGTYGYMAPEQFRGAADIDARADTFALGMILWRLLVGGLPVSPDDMAALTQMYMGVIPIPALTHLRTDIPEDLAALVARAVALDPGQRFPDARSLAESLATLRDLPGGAPGPAPTPIPAVPAGGPAPARPRAIPQAIHAPPTVLEEAPPRAAIPPAVPPEPPPGAARTTRGPMLVVAALGGVAVMGAVVVALVLATGRQEDRSPGAAGGVREAPHLAATSEPGPTALAGSSSGAPGSARWTAPVSGYQMVLVQPGTFVMGSPPFEPGRDPDEDAHRVVLTRPFYLGTTEVTQQLWQSVTGASPSEFSGAQNPVEKVSWLDAVAFANALSARDGFSSAYTIRGSQVTWDPSAPGYRLPTEAEWEYAAREMGGSRRYSGSDNLGAVGWYKDNAGGRTHPVALLQPNSLGLYDMTGNVWEWVWDWYGPYPSAVTDPTGPASGTDRCFRGGDWKDTPDHERTTNRGYYKPGTRSSRYGVRLARNGG